MYLDRDGVTELAGKWGRAAEGLGKAAEHVRSTEMNAQSFGAEHAEQMVSVRQRLDQLADNMRDWGRYVGDYRGKLRAAVDAFTEVDAASAQGVESVSNGLSERDV
ncbi:type VII secretion target [Mycobacteroides abscessus]|uniref:type VII secretion target n=1 Tax=Mycobacteroides abscessus TaxID=36809 RepID=UPI0009259677|nr:type VII secretion target [Mycobacteroides abscessus]MCU8694544.1 type VII secretion target [Mycobacteroides abscessus]MCU8713708.1 type VII secretion target [Mycobacteroides abscessus]MCU8715591.1 type VII secretion target [Mycobacteroides abscessus]MCU8752513.1 type VII secretion target [Mycobacteroides abscessus]MCU8757376.1 type VII secretion target [Mycobacteroides abscessus]